MNATIMPLVTLAPYDKIRVLSLRAESVNGMGYVWYICSENWTETRLNAKNEGHYTD